MCRRRVMTMTAIAPPITAPQMPRPPRQIWNARQRVVLEQLVVGDHVVEARADHAPDHDPERDVVDAVLAGSRGGATAARRRTTATSTPTARITPYMWKGPRLPLDGLGIEPSSGWHRALIVGAVTRSACLASRFRRRTCRYRPHAPRICSCSRPSRARRRCVLAACLPPARRRPRPRPPPTTPTAPRPRPADDARPPRRRAADAAGRGRRTGRSAAAASSRPTTRGTATSRRSPSTPTRRNYIAAIAALGGNQKLHADFGGGGEYGIPYITVPGHPGAASRSTSIDYGDESDPGPYPIPLAAPVEGGSDAARARGRPRPLQALRAVRGEPGARPLGGRLGRGVRPHVERAAPRGLDLGRRRRAPDLPRPRPLRRGGERPHRPRAALHGVAVAAGLPPPGHALRVVEHRPEPPADGPAPAAEGELRRRRRTPGRPASCSTR